jgi:hypothetical protein
MELAALNGKLLRIFVWGSFVTAKVAHKDLDILLIMHEDFEVDGVAAPARGVFDSVRPNCCSRPTSSGLDPPSGAKCSIYGWTPIRLPEAFENAVLWNWSCRDSNRRPNAPCAAMRR